MPMPLIRMSTKKGPQKTDAAQPRISTPRNMARRWLAKRKAVLRGEQITKIDANTATGTGKPGRAGAAGSDGYGLRADTGGQGTGLEAVNWATISLRVKGMGRQTSI